MTNRLLRRIRDLAQVNGMDRVDEATANEGMEMMGIDEEGLVSMDRKILKAITRGHGDAVGLKTISVSVGEEDDTIEEVYEPFLIQKGFIIKTPRGRKITPEGEKHIGLKAKLRGKNGEEQEDLFSQ